MKRYRAFTIVELAVVLVVIGIILAMAVKGKALIETAKMKAEVNKIRKLEAAMHIYMISHKSLPLAGMEFGNQFVDMKAFFDLGVVSEGELRSMYTNPTTHHSDKPARYIPHYCYIRPDGFYNIRLTTGEKPENYSFCAVLLNYIDYSDYAYIALPPRFQCNAEVILDDENISSGLGRRGNTFASLDVNPTEFSAAEYNNCTTLDNEVTPYTEFGYFYRIY